MPDSQLTAQTILAAKSWDTQEVEAIMPTLMSDGGMRLEFFKHNALDVGLTLNALRFQGELKLNHAEVSVIIHRSTLHTLEVADELAKHLDDPLNTLSNHFKDLFYLFPDLSLETAKLALTHSDDPAKHVWLTLFHTRPTSTDSQVIDFYLSHLRGSASWISGRVSNLQIALVGVQRLRAAHLTPEQTTEVDTLYSALKDSMDLVAFTPGESPLQRELELVASMYPIVRYGVALGTSYPELLALLTADEDKAVAMLARWRLG